jgi:hypothetical protein
MGPKRTGDLISRISSDSDRICSFLSQHLLDFVTDVLMIVLTSIILFQLDPWLALGRATAVPDHSVDDPSGKSPIATWICTGRACMGIDGKCSYRCYTGSSSGKGVCARTTGGGAFRKCESACSRIQCSHKQALVVFWSNGDCFDGSGFVA